MPVSLGEKLREMRGNMSLREASQKTGLSHTYICQLENGIDPRSGKKIVPSLTVLEQIADGYGIPREELLVVVGYLKPAGDSHYEDDERSDALDKENRNLETWLYESGVQWIIDGEEITDDIKRIMLEMARFAVKRNKDKQ